ncbi:MAG: hypothetical protein OCC46_08015 [Pseudodesulfovibrio sp.]
MTIRTYVKCLTCGTVHTLRIGLGHSDHQEHTILCKECEEELKVEIALDQSKGTSQFSYGENTEEFHPEEVKYGNEGYPVINLHPELTFSPDLEGIDVISPTVIALMENQRKLQEKMKKQKGTQATSQDESQDPKNIFVLDGEWKDLRPCWSQYNKRKKRRASLIAESKSSNYCKSEATPEEWIQSFAKRTISPDKLNLITDCYDKIDEIRKQSPDNFAKFVDYHKDIFAKNIKKSFSVFDEFFKLYSNFSACLWDYKRGTSALSFSATTCNFESVKYFYGNTFEIVGSGIVTLACLANLHKGRTYNEFQTAGFTLEKYIQSDKSGRTNCLQDIAEFADIFPEYRSSIRNGSHHGTFELNTASMIIDYSPRTPQQTETMQFSEYIYYCIAIFFSCATLTAVDLYLNELANK